MRGRPSYGAVASTLALIVALSGVTYAAIPDANDGVIHGCYKSSGRHLGTLRVIDLSLGWKCSTTSETPINWVSAPSAYNASGQRLGTVLTADGSTIHYLAPNRTIYYA